MMAWLVILAVTLAAFAAGIVFLIGSVSRSETLEKACGGRRGRQIAAAAGVVAAVFGASWLAMSLMNAIVVLLHWLAFSLLTEAVFRLAVWFAGRHKTEDRPSGRGEKREPSRRLRIRLAALLTALWLAAGYVCCRQIRQTNYTLRTDKPVGGLRVALLADSHLGVTLDGERMAAELERIEAQSPDILLIAGDFVDDGSSKADLLRTCEALGQLNLRYGVWFSYGNHDKGYFGSRDFTAQELEDALRGCGVHILEDECVCVDGRFNLAGRMDATDGQRREISALLQDADSSLYTIVMDHVPGDYEQEAASTADLVVSGHTHGGQLLPITWIGEWFGMNDRTYGYERRGGTDFIVTSGISDWELLFKTGTMSEFVILDIQSA